MTNEDYKKFMESFQAKIGKETSAKVADDIAKLTSDMMKVNKDIKDRDDKIKSLEDDKENLMKTNLNLLQQIPMTDEPIKKGETKEEPAKNAEAFNYRDCFDEFGNFK